MDEPSLERAIAAARPPARGRATVLATVRRRLFATADAPETIGRYVIRGKLGSGGMGVVWAAFDPRLDRTVAIKLLRTDRGRNDEQRGRLLREAQALARLGHPNVVEVFDVGAHGQAIYIAMALVEGCTLAHWLATERRSWPAVIEVFSAAGRGLLAAHAVDLVHRDFKPQNVMIGDDGRVRVMDFGLAQAVQGSTDDDGPATPCELPWLHDALTSTGQRVGTPAYMSPEQHDGAAIDARTDQFGFCAALYEALVGVAPFRAPSLALLAQDKREGRITPPRPGHGVPARVLAVVRRGLAPDPARRWPSMAALLHALQRAATARRRVVVGALACTGVAAVLLAASIATPPPCEPPATPWTDERRADVDAAFGRLEGGWVHDARVRTLAVLDDHGAAWTRAAAQTCEGTAIEDRERARDCLHRDRQRFGALVDRFAAGDAQQMQLALEASLALGSPSACVDPQVLAGAAEPPTNPALARRIDAVRDELAQIWVLERLGRFETALAMVDEVLRDPTTQQHGSLLAEAEMARGNALVDLGEHEQAAAALARSYFVAMDAGEHGIAGDSATLLVFSLGTYSARHEDAFDWARHAEAALALTPDDIALRAELAINVGIVHAARGEIGLAQAQYRDAMTMLADQPRDHGSLANAMQYLGLSYVEEGRYDEARDLLTQVVRTRERVLGPEHGLVATARVNLANALTRAGDHEGALAEHRRALEISQATYGASHPEVGVQHNNLGAVLAAMGEHERAREEHARALELFEAALDGDHPYVGATLVNLGRLDVQLGRLDLAAVELARARTVLERVLGADHPHVAYALLGLGELDVAGGEPGRALEVLGRAHAGCERAEPLLCAEIRFVQARAHAAVGDPQTGVRMAALARDEAGTGADADDLRARIDAQLDAWTRTRSG